MNFQQRHRPASVNDLVFRDADTEQVIRDYAAGIRKKHLLLDGPTSSGKSEAARIILKERLSATMGDAYASVYHGQGFDARTVKTIRNDWNFQMMMCGEAYSVIDEVDFVNADGRKEIRKLIDNCSYGTLVCTTNFARKLEHEFASRFLSLRIDVPQPTDWHQRAKQILSAEGITLTDQQIARILKSFSGHGRNFSDLMQETTISIKRTLIREKDATFLN